MKSQIHALRNSSSDDSGFFSPDAQLFKERELQKKIELEEADDSLTPLKKIQKKPLSYYKKQTNKPSVKNLINRWNKNETKKEHINKNATTHCQSNQPNTYQTTFIRIWPSDHTDVRYSFLVVF